MMFWLNASTLILVFIGFYGVFVELDTIKGLLEALQ